MPADEDAAPDEDDEEAEEAEEDEEALFRYPKKLEMPPRGAFEANADADAAAGTGGARSMTAAELDAEHDG